VEVTPVFGPTLPGPVDLIVDLSGDRVDPSQLTAPRLAYWSFVYGDEPERIAPGLQEYVAGGRAAYARLVRLDSLDRGTVLKEGSVKTVGPSLGADSIRHGVQASILSLLVVMVFMVFYYRSSGVNAVLALIINLVILLAALAMFGAVLTLPGIAGVILTIGMGVDSNVLVFERIREELRNGKSAAAAVDAGFSKAFLTIIDTHVTTVVSAFFLFIFGTGPIKGFAITLTIGLIANVFTAIYVSKTIFQYHLGKMDRQAELSI